MTPLKIKNKAASLLKALFLALFLSAFAFAGTAQRTYIVSVGVGKSANGGDPLPCPVNDARTLARFFKDNANANVFMLLDSNATRDHILRVLRNQFAKSTESDQIIFTYSGHGFDGGIACYSDPVFVWEIQDIMKAAKASRKMMFINACHSGSFTRRTTPQNKFIKNYKSNDYNVMLYLSSRPDELSWETSAMHNSFFVSNLLDGLRGGADANSDRKVTARELFNYVNAGVIDDTDDRQHPQMYGKFPDDLVIVNLD